MRPETKTPTALPGFFFALPDGAGDRRWAK